LVAEGCPACTNLKAFFDLTGVSYEFHAIDRDSPERAALRGAGFDTVPQVFTPAGLHLGDWSAHLQAALDSLRQLYTA
jgi:glutaredoxin